MQLHATTSIYNSYVNLHWKVLFLLQKSTSGITSVVRFINYLVKVCY